MSVSAQESLYESDHHWVPLLIEPDPLMLGKEKVLSTGPPDEFFVGADDSLPLNGALLRSAEQGCQYDYVNSLKNDQERRAYLERTFRDYWWSSYTRQAEGGMHFTVVVLKDKHKVIDEFRDDLVAKYGDLTRRAPEETQSAALPRSGGSVKKWWQFWK